MRGSTQTNWKSSPLGAPAQASVGLTILGTGVGNLFPMAVSAAVATAPDRAGQASCRAVAMSSAAVLLAPLAIGTLADATSLKGALVAVPILLVAASAGLVLLSRLATDSSDG